tara:strand:- start:1250 stop:1459 length:210 start_codon:yes stop_codon:yes gene_type:complete
MNFREITQGINVQISLEEKELLGKMNTLCDYAEFTERQQYVLDNLVRKDIIKKVLYQGKTYLVNNAAPS